MRQRTQGERMVRVGRGGSFQIAHVESGVQILKERRRIPLHRCVARLRFGRSIPEGDGAPIVCGVSSPCENRDTDECRSSESG